MSRELTPAEIQQRRDAARSRWEKAGVAAGAAAGGAAAERGVTAMVRRYNVKRLEQRQASRGGDLIQRWRADLTAKVRAREARITEGLADAERAIAGDTKGAILAYHRRRRDVLTGAARRTEDAEGFAIRSEATARHPGTGINEDMPPRVARQMAAGHQDAIDRISGRDMHSKVQAEGYTQNRKGKDVLVSGYKRNQNRGRIPPAQAREMRRTMREHMGQRTDVLNQRILTYADDLWNAAEERGATRRARAARIVQRVGQKFPKANVRIGTAAAGAAIGGGLAYAALHGRKVEKLEKAALTEAQRQQRVDAGKASAAKRRGFIGWRVSEQEKARLSAKFPPGYARFIGGHVTDIYGVDEDHPLPMERAARIIGIADDTKGVQALVLRLQGKRQRPDGKRHHITWSLAEGRSPVESNDVIAAGGWKRIKGTNVVLEPEFFPFERQAKQTALAKAAPGDDPEVPMASGLARAFVSLRDAVADIIDRMRHPVSDLFNENRYRDMLKTALDPLGRPFMRSAKAAGTPDGEDKVLAVTFELIEPRVFTHLDSYRMGLIQQITDGQRETIRRIVTTMMAQGKPPAVMAREIKEMVGLTPHQAQNVSTFRAGLEGLDPKVLGRSLRDRRYDRTIQRAIDTNTPIPADRVDAMVEAYQRRAIALRATTIARTESLRAANLGSVAGAREAAEMYGLDVEKTWLATKDARTRDTHRELDGQMVRGMDLPFILQSGQTIRWPHDPAAAAHETINCRCTLQVRLVPRQARITQLRAEAVEQESMA